MGHNHAHGSNRKVLLFSFIITTAYMFVEATGGFLTNSLALLSDAGHMMSDSISLGVGLLAFTYGAKASDSHKTFGYKRFEILAAVFNGVALLVVSIYIFYEAIHRFADPPEVATSGMLWIALIGLLVNVLIAFIMRKGDTQGNLNLRAAFLHVLSDLLGSVGAIVAALLIMFFDWGWADPLASVIVAVLVLLSGWRVTRDAVHVLMEGTPAEVDLTRVRKRIEQVPEVISVHDLHVWSITSGLNAIACHVVIGSHLTMADAQKLLNRIEKEMMEEQIEHTTIQLETEANTHTENKM
ncbi:cation diffusion facilitator family transporter [Filibacter tadaridae]|uniref:Cadmium, cobalt and zinc/H(+)-K(+) antiporter n=1 Tax=Filibacter tadaridae TaxID=2483811 RepID=A0A3P5XAM7_9BACL|nr:cation diffusion facilitator family transporter [Filibacter tadaridae]VDC25517.1 Cadmium, cobalt and zinc/H(+)-K(+) antiporter [Filibacter tadaridae]